MPVATDNSREHILAISGMSGTKSNSQKLLPLLSVRDMRELLLAGGHDEKSIRSLSSLAGLPQNTLTNSKGYLSLDMVWRLISANIAVLGDSLSGLGNQKLGVTATEIVIGRAMHEANFGDAIIAFADAVNSIVPDLEMNVRQRFGELHVSVIFPEGMTPVRQTFLEICSLYWHCNFCWLLGELAHVARVATCADRKHSKTQVMSAFGCPIVFADQGIELVYAKGLSRQKIDPPPLANNAGGVFAMLDDLIDAQKVSINNDGVLNYVRRAIQNGVTDQATIAASLGMSVATLRRRLMRLNTDFRKLRKELMGEQALMLIQQGKTVDEIAERLGYSEERSFRRAFQNLYGASPSEYRDRLIVDSKPVQTGGDCPK